MIVRKPDEGRRTVRNFAGVAPSAMFQTTTTTWRMRPVVASQAATLGCEETVVPTSFRTSASV